MQMHIKCGMLTYVFTFMLLHINTIGGGRVEEKKGRVKMIKPSGTAVA
jgi:hypothetical protein